MGPVISPIINRTRATAALTGALTIGIASALALPVAAYGAQGDNDIVIGIIEDATPAVVTIQVIPQAGPTAEDGDLPEDFQLPDGFELPEGFELPDDIGSLEDLREFLPEGFDFPEGFEFDGTFDHRACPERLGGVKRSALKRVEAG